MEGRDEDSPIAIDMNSAPLDLSLKEIEIKIANCTRLNAHGRGKTNKGDYAGHGKPQLKCQQ